MEHYLSLFVRAVFIENMALAWFLGMCTFSRRLEENLCGVWFGYRCGSGAHHYRPRK